MTFATFYFSGSKVDLSKRLHTTLSCLAICFTIWLQPTDSEIFLLFLPIICVFKDISLSSPFQGKMYLGSQFLKRFVLVETNKRNIMKKDHENSWFIKICMWEEHSRKGSTHLFHLVFSSRFCVALLTAIDSNQNSRVQCTTGDIR